MAPADCGEGGVEGGEGFGGGAVGVVVGGGGLEGFVVPGLGVDGHEGGHFH